MSTQGWLADVQGVQRVLDGADVTYPRRRAIKFVGPSVSDDGTNTVVDMTDTGIADAAFAAALAPNIRGPGLTVSGGKLLTRARPRKIQLTDHFIGGNSTSGSIGALGWNLLGAGTPALTREHATSLSTGNKIELATSAGGTDRTVLSLGDAEDRAIAAPVDVEIIQLVTAFATHLTTKKFFFGFAADFADDPAAAVDCFGFFYDSTVGANWLLIARAASAGSPQDTGIAVPSDTHELLSIHQHSAGSYRFYVGATLVGTIASGVPSATQNIGAAVYNTTTTARNQRIGGFALNAALAGAYDDDAALEA